MTLYRLAQHVGDMLDRLWPPRTDPRSRSYEAALVAAEEETEVHEAVEHAFFPCGQYAPDRDALLPYRCTLEDGHEGVHVAWAGKLPIAEWSDESRFVYEPNTSPTAVPASLVGDLSTANPPAVVDNAPSDCAIPPAPEGAPNLAPDDLIHAANIIDVYRMLHVGDEPQRSEYIALANLLASAAVAQRLASEADPNP